MKQHLTYRASRVAFRLCLSFLLTATVAVSFAQTIYRSRATGNWNSSSTWEISTNNGSSWANATNTPNATNATAIRIRNGHNVTQNVTVTVQGLIIEAGATLTSSASNATLTIAKGDQANMVVEGTYLRSNGTVVTEGTITFAAGSRYVHDRLGNSIPVATWHPESIVEVRRWNGHVGDWNQNFGRMELGSGVSGFNANIEFPTDVYIKNATLNLNTGNNQNRTIKVNGNLIMDAANANMVAVQNSGSLTLEVTGNIDLGATGKFSGSNANNGNLTIKVGGNFNAGRSFLGAQNNAAVQMDVAGNFSVSESFTGTNGNGKATLNVGGNFHSGKQFTGTQNNADLDLKVGGHFTATDKFVSTNGNGKVNIDIKGNFNSTKDFVALQNNATAVINIGGHLHAGDKLVLTNGNNGKAVDLIIHGNWYAADETICAQNNAGVDIHVKGDVIGSSRKFTCMQGNGNFTMLVEGSFTQTKGDFDMAPNEGNAVVTVKKDFTFSGNRFYFTGSGSNKQRTLNVAGDMNVTAGTMEAMNGVAEINLNGNGEVQTYRSGITYKGRLNFFVRSGAFVQMDVAGTHVGGTGTFTLEAAATLGIRAVPGITLTGNTCHIRVSGSRSYNKAANYIYNGSDAQLTGNGFVEGANLTIDNPAGVTLQQHAGVTKTMWLEQGLFTTAKDKLITIFNASTEAVVGGGKATFVNGPMLWHVTAVDDAYTFPVGKVIEGRPVYRYFRLAEVSSQSAFTGEYFPATPPGRQQDKSFGFFRDMLTGILSNEYWQIDRHDALGKATARVVLEYRPSELSKGWLAVDGKGITPNDAAQVAVVKGVGDISKGVWNFALAPNSYRTLSVGSQAAMSVSHKEDGEIASAAMDEFSPFTMGFGYFKILPLDLRVFEGRLINGIANLEWTLADAKDLAGFEVEHSTNGQQFARLATVGSHGGTAYKFMHKTPVTDANYYRLLMIEKDGSRQYSKTVLIQAGAGATTQVSLQTNPVVGGRAMVNLQSATAQKADITVIDMSGRILRKQQVQLPAGAQQVAVSTQGLPTGYYRLLVHTTDGTLQQLPFMQ